MKGIKDAESFYAAVKGNPLYESMNDRDVIAALDDYFEQLFRVAKDEHLMGIHRDRFMFFQGMVAGMRTQSKIFTHAHEVEAAKQNIDIATGEKYGSNQDN